MIQTLRGHDGQVSSVVFTPDGKRIVSGSLDKTVRVWDVATARELPTLSGHKGHKGRVWSLAISPDGEFIASGGDNSDGELTLWETGTGRRLWSQSAHGHFYIAGWVAGDINGLAFRPGDGGRIVSSGHDKELKLWNSTTGAHVATMSGHEDTVSSVAFSPDGKRIASASTDSTVRLWDEASGEELATLLGHAGPVFSVAFSPDGQQIVSGGEDTTLKLWDADNRPNVLRLRGHIGGMRAVAFSPDGRYLTSGGFDSAKIWEVVTGEEVRNLHGQGGVLAVAYSPDGRYIATGGHDTTMKLWDAHTGRELRTFRGHKAMVNHVVFSSDGQRIASAGNYDGTVRLWDVAGDRAPSVFTQKGYAEGVAFSPDGRLLASAAVWGEGSVRLGTRPPGMQCTSSPASGAVLVGCCSPPTERGSSWAVKMVRSGSSMPRATRTFRHSTATAAMCAAWRSVWTVSALLPAIRMGPSRYGMP